MCVYVHTRTPTVYPYRSTTLSRDIHHHAPWRVSLACDQEIRAGPFSLGVEFLTRANECHDTRTPDPLFESSVRIDMRDGRIKLSSERRRPIETFGDVRRPSQTFAAFADLRRPSRVLRLVTYRIVSYRGENPRRCVCIHLPNSAIFSEWSTATDHVSPIPFSCLPLPSSSPSFSALCVFSLVRPLIRSIHYTCFLVLYATRIYEHFQSSNTIEKSILCANDCVRRYCTRARSLRSCGCRCSLRSMRLAC